MTTYARPGPLGPGVYAQVTSLATAVSVAASLPDLGTIPPGGSQKNSDLNCALIQAETQNIRWRDDGTAPTASVGQLLAAGSSIFFEGDLNLLKIIEVTTSAKANITFYATSNAFS